MGLDPDTLTYDCAEPARVARFWAGALGFVPDLDDDGPDGDAYVADPSGRTRGIFFQKVPEPKVTKNRVHLDLRPATTRAEEVERLRGLGAEPIREVRERASWTVMADVEGNELCVLEGAAEGAKRDRPGLDSVVIDCADPFRVAAFWVEALGYAEHEHGASGIELVGPRDGDPMLSFVTVPEPKTVKNRLHLDLRPSGTMREEVARLSALGATSLNFVEIPASAVDGQGTFWTVMADVEGNELCVLRGPGDGWSRETS
ncbi:MAG TPA: VOC family protein [Actinomycetota bacterium]|nr:VOC family protein [Actinomycetota bacterium]